MLCNGVGSGSELLFIFLCKSRFSGFYAYL